MVSLLEALHSLARKTSRPALSDSNCEMAGGLAVAPLGARSTRYQSQLTWRVWLVCVLASSGGLLFGFDLGGMHRSSLSALSCSDLTRNVSHIFGSNNVFFSSGIAGGVASMQGFLERFFPEVILQKQEANTSTGNKDYCQFDSQASLLL